MTTLDSRPVSADPGWETAVSRFPRDGWVDVIAATDLPAELGVPALVGGRAVAVFRTVDGEVHALCNLDPMTGASVMARGIVGSRGDTPTVASPLYKHVFDLRTGHCLDDESMRLDPFEVRVRGGVVQVRGRDDAAQR